MAGTVSDRNTIRQNISDKKEKQMDRERFEKQLDFILEIDKEKQILRQTHIRGYSRQEDDAEHAWHMAVMAFLLQEYSNEKIDIGSTMLMLLIHDLVEIDAGDTYAYDAEANKTKEEREQKAADRIYGLLPEDQGEKLMELWREFEAYETPEARFAHVMDNFQPMLLNYENGGKDWMNHKVRISQPLKRNEKTATGSEEIWSYMEELLENSIKNGTILDDRKEKQD